MGLSVGALIHRRGLYADKKERQVGMTDIIRHNQNICIKNEENVLD